jgi:hypothetical protein
VEESCHPFDVPSLYRIGKIGKLDCQKTAHFAEVLDSPTGRSRAEFVVTDIDIRSFFYQQPDYRTVSAKGGVMKRRGAQLISPVDKFGMTLQDGSDLCDVSLFGSLNELLEFVRHLAHPANRDGVEP